MWWDDIKCGDEIYLFWELLELGLLGGGMGGLRREDKVRGKPICDAMCSVAGSLGIWV